MRRWNFSYYDASSIFRRMEVMAADKTEAAAKALSQVGERQKEPVLVWCCLEA